MNHTLPYYPNQRLAYVDYGTRDGCPLLVQHGLLASSRDFHLFDRLLAAGVRLICVARPGYGNSSPYPMCSIAEWGEIVALLVDTFQLAHVDVLGISSGAPYSYAIARRLPECVRNIFIARGVPALYDARIAALWPYPSLKDADLGDVQQLAHQLFFAPLAPDEQHSNAIQDSWKHAGFGVAQALRLRWRPWGFELAEIHVPVIMQPSLDDPESPVRTAELTATLLPQCQFDIRPSAEHVSQTLLDQLIAIRMLEHYRTGVMKAPAEAPCGPPRDHDR